MLFVSLIVFVPLISFALAIDKRIHSPMVLFTIIWGVICIFSSMRLFHFIEVSEKVYYMICMGGVFFSLGCLFGKKTKKFIASTMMRNNQKLDRYMRGLQYFSCVIFLWAALAAIMLLMQGKTMNDIYNMRILMSYGVETDISSSSKLMSILLEYVGRPVLAISIPYSVIKFLKDKQLLPIILTIIMLLLSFVSRGNRLDFVCFACTVVFSYGLINKQFRLSSKQKKYIIIIAFLASIGFFWITLSRGKIDMLETIYAYLCGNVPFSAIKIEALGEAYTKTYFATSLQGMLRVINQFVEMLGIGEWKLMALAEQYANVETASVITTKGGLFNAFVGPFYFFYCDGGWFGVAFFSFLCGYLSEKIYKVAFEKDDMIVWTLYLIVIVRGVLFSFYNFLFVSIMYGMAVIILLILNRATKRKRVRCYLK